MDIKPLPDTTWCWIFYPPCVFSCIFFRRAVCVALSRSLPPSLPLSLFPSPISFHNPLNKLYPLSLHGVSIGVPPPNFALAPQGTVPFYRNHYGSVTDKIYWVWWCTPLSIAFRSLRQEDFEFEAILGNLGRSCLKTRHQKHNSLKSSIVRANSRCFSNLMISCFDKYVGNRKHHTKTHWMYLIFWTLQFNIVCLKHTQNT